MGEEASSSKLHVGTGNQASGSGSAGQKEKQAREGVKGSGPGSGSGEKRTRHKLPRGVVKGKDVEQDVSPPPSPGWPRSCRACHTNDPVHLFFSLTFHLSLRGYSRIDGCPSNNDVLIKPNSLKTRRAGNTRRNGPIINSRPRGEKSLGWALRGVRARTSE